MFHLFQYAGKPTRALDTLYDVIKSKKRNNNFSEKLIEQVNTLSITAYNLNFIVYTNGSQTFLIRGTLKIF
jgi:hypothetical protein